jgi:GTPase
VAIVGYTNAGKSTLLNALTKSDVFVADRLFATLDPTTRRLHLGNNETILLTDTVGFIHELPPPLVDAFRATLEEVTEADALIHLVDASNPVWEAQVESVKQILADMPIVVGPTLLVFNKFDRVADLDAFKSRVQANYPGAVVLSAVKRHGLDLLCQALTKMLSKSW